MASLDYAILAKLMSYVFTLLGALIVWRTFSWLRKDQRETRRRLKALPDAGTIGILTVLKGSSELEEGTIIPVPPEGVLGFVRTCDIVVPVNDVVSQHLDFTFRNGKGLYIYPRRGCPAAVDGVTLDSRADSRRYPMQHGSILSVGEAVLQLGVFAGLDVRQTSGVWLESTPPEPLTPPSPEPVMPPELHQPFRHSAPYPAQDPSALQIPLYPQSPYPQQPPYPPQAPGMQPGSWPVQEGRHGHET